MRRTVVTFKPDQVETHPGLLRLKASVKAHNKKLKGLDYRFAVRYSYTMAEGNPNAWKYQNQWKRRLRMEDASEVRAYVGTRRVK